MSLSIKSITVVLIIVFSLSLNKVNCQHIKIDHVICVVKDLDKSIEFYEKNGFTLKMGRLHKNGLLNAHIKFKNSSSYELMTVKGTPGDAIAKNYEKLLKEGEGGVFIAITGIKVEEMEQRLSKEDIPYQVVKTRNWTYITFSETSGFEHFFFIDYNIKVKDDIETLTHSNQSTKIGDVYIDADGKVLDFFKIIGLKMAGTVNDLKLGTAIVFKTETGNILAVPTKDSNKRARIRAITFCKEDNSETLRVDF